MAEEVKDEAKLALDESKIAELIKQNVSSSMKEVTEALSKQNTQQVYTPPQEEEDVSTDAWDEIISPRVERHTKKSLDASSRAALQAEAAEDKADFYSSDLWVVDLEDFFTSDDPAERRKEKADFRKELEERFSNLLKSGRGMKREEIAQYMIGSSENRKKYTENQTKKQKKQDEQDGLKAQRNVDIGSFSISNFDAQSIHDMDFDEVAKKFGSYTF